MALSKMVVMKVGLVLFLIGASSIAAVDARYDLAKDFRQIISQSGQSNWCCKNCDCTIEDVGCYCADWGEFCHDGCDLCLCTVPASPEVPMLGCLKHL
ncbi:hypothetical protein L6164_028589 [Bauhinia variegata]|uniref:Uncharacterized protein n=1 Tax=Bauhinia variegata TaxID=167791 RepID=A0ACB9L6M5_BAUVA|nr:hypothetical protein L6164_028589 [Bauhinia variegata]